MKRYAFAVWMCMALPAAAQGYGSAQGSAAGGATDTTGLTDITLVGGNEDDTMRITGGVLTPNGTLTISADSNVTVFGTLAFIGSGPHIVGPITDPLAIQSGVGQALNLLAGTGTVLRLGLGSLTDGLAIEPTVATFRLPVAFRNGLGVIATIAGPSDESFRIQDQGGALTFRSAGVGVVLVDGVSTTIATVDVQAGELAGGVIEYSIRATDGTDHQTSSGTVNFSIINKAGVLTGSINKSGTTTTVTSVGTLSTSFSIDTTDATVEIELDANAIGLTPTTFQVRFQIHNCSGEIITIP